VKPHQHLAEKKSFFIFLFLFLFFQTKSYCPKTFDPFYLAFSQKKDTLGFRVGFRVGSSLHIGQKMYLSRECTRRRFTDLKLYEIVFTINN
jgi:hypothetical protein